MVAQFGLSTPRRPSLISPYDHFLPPAIEPVYDSVSGLDESTSSALGPLLRNNGPETLRLLRHRVVACRLRC